MDQYRHRDVGLWSHTDHSNPIKYNKLHSKHSMKWESSQGCREFNFETVFQFDIFVRFHPKRTKISKLKVFIENQSNFDPQRYNPSDKNLGHCMYFNGDIKTAWPDSIRWVASTVWLVLKQWKKAYIRPIPTIPARKQLANFHPISITPVLHRIIEYSIVSHFL